MRVADLIGDRPLSARSVLATALLGADQPHLTVGELVAIASLFGISDGAARTCLWRMVSNGELASDDGTEPRPQEACSNGANASTRHQDRRWVLRRRGMGRGSWRSSRWNAGRRPTGLRCAKPRQRCTSPNCGRASGFARTIWTRTACRGLRAVLDRQCVHFHDAATDIPAETVRSLFSLDDWAADARRLTLAVRDELDAEAVAADDFTYRFGLSVTVVRHLQLDPLLPVELLPQEWPGQELRSAYRRFDEVFKQRLSSAFR